MSTRRNGVRWSGTVQGAQGESLQTMFWLKANFRGLKEKKIHIGCRVAIENIHLKKSEEENEVQKEGGGRRKTWGGSEGWKKTHRLHLQRHSWPWGWKGSSCWCLLTILQARPRLCPGWAGPSCAAPDRRAKVTGQLGPPPLGSASCSLGQEAQILARHLHNRTMCFSSSKVRLFLEIL